MNGIHSLAVVALLSAALMPAAAQQQPTLLDVGREIRVVAPPLPKREAGTITRLTPDSVFFERKTFLNPASFNVAWQNVQSVEVNRPSRMVAFLGGVAAGYLGVWMAEKDAADEGGYIPVGAQVGVVLGAGVLSALLFPADRWEPVPVPK